MSGLILPFRNAVGVIAQNANFGGMNDLFFVQPPPGQTYYIFQTHTTIATPVFPATTDYAGIAGGLVNGTTIEIKLNGVVSYPVIPVKQNQEWFAFSDVEISYLAGGTAIIKVSSDIPNGQGTSLVLNGNTNDYLGIRILDDLTAVPFQVSFLEGTYEIH